MNHQAHLNVKKFRESQREKRELGIRRKTLSFAKPGTKWWVGEEKEEPVDVPLS